MLSDYDAWYPCGLHGGTPYPDSDEPSDFDFEAHNRKVNRAAFARFRNMALGAGCSSKDFAEMVAGRVDSDRKPGDWVDAAEDVAVRFVEDAADANAVRAGFSCALEMRFAADAEMERSERRGY